MLLTSAGLFLDTLQNPAYPDPAHPEVTCELRMAWEGAGLHHLVVGLPQRLIVDAVLRSWFLWAMTDQPPLRETFDILIGEPEIFR